MFLVGTLLFFLSVHSVHALLHPRGRIISSSIRRDALRNPKETAFIQINQAVLPAATVLLTLLGPSIASAATKGYLTEPTKEFVDEVSKTKELKTERLKLRAKWDALLSKLEIADTSDSIEVVLKDMMSYLSAGVVPPDFKKFDLVKLCRTKKFLTPENKRSKKTTAVWTTPVEIAYQALVFEYNKQLAPNNKPEPEAM
jgi:hypothetical protein